MEKRKDIEHATNTGNPCGSSTVTGSVDHLKVLDLFSGIGVFSLGLERGGMKTVAFCEIEEFPRRVLRKHWPDVPIFNDVRILHATDLPAVDVICGGFPCQDISKAGKQTGIAGQRSCMWGEMLRLTNEIRPKFLLAENVCALRVNGLAQVMQDLWEIGYDTEWHIIPASAFGAHKRERVWIIANPHSGGRKTPWLTQSVAEIYRQETHKQLQIEKSSGVDGWERRVFKPRMGRIIDDAPGRMDRLKALGNSLIPQIPELIGRAIMPHIT